MSVRSHPASIVPTLAGADAAVNTVGPHGLGHTTIQRDSLLGVDQSSRADLDYLARTGLDTVRGLR